MQPMYRDAARQKLINLELHLIRTFHLTSYEATKINEYVRREFVLPYAVKRTKTSPDGAEIYELPCAVENSARKARR